MYTAYECYDNCVIDNICAFSVSSPIVSTRFNIIIIIGNPLFIRRCHILEWPLSLEVSGRLVTASGSK